MPFSHHSHSGQFCLHAKNTLEEMVQAAVQKKLKMYALTEHMPRDQAEDLYPEEIEAQQTPATLSKTFEAFHREATRLRALYASRIKLLIGFESDWIRPSSCANLIGALRQRYRFDLFVGSVHHVHAIPIDFDRATYERARAGVVVGVGGGGGGGDGGDGGGADEAIFDAYFDAQLQMLEQLRPPIVGHFDLIRLFSDDPDVDIEQTYPEVWRRRVVRNLEFVLEYGGVLEVNSAALRKGMREPYPGRRIVEAFMKLGGRLTLSDDAHAVDQVAGNYHRVLPYLRELGVTELHYFDIVAVADTDTDGQDVVLRSMPLDEVDDTAFRI